MATPRWDDKNQKWILSVMVDRKRKEFTSTSPGRSGLADVRKKYQKWILGETDKSHWRIEKCWPLFLEDVKARSGADNYRVVKQIGELYILPKVKMVRVGAISTADWQKVINTTHGTKVYDLSKKTLSNVRGVIVSFCTYATRDGMMDALPVGLYVPKSAQSIGKEIIQPKQLKSIFEPSDEWYVNAWRIMALTGLRPGEVYGLQRDDIKDGLLTVRRSLNNRGIVTDGKNKNAHREILLHTFAQDIIDAQLAKINAKGLIGPWLFPNHQGYSVIPNVAYKRWKLFAVSHGFYVPPYSLRHTFISLMKNDMPSEMVKMIVGHSESMDTFGVYGKKVSGELKRSQKVMNVTFKKLLK